MRHPFPGRPPLRTPGLFPSPNTHLETLLMLPAPPPPFSPLSVPPCTLPLSRHRLALDLLTTLPWDWIVLSATGVRADTTTGRYIALLSLLKLGRMYRVVVLFYNLSYNLKVGLLTLTLFRNFTVSFHSDKLSNNNK